MINKWLDEKMEEARGQGRFDSYAGTDQTIIEMSYKVSLLKEEVESLHSIFRLVEDWDCQGDSLSDAYNEVYGAGSWDEHTGVEK